MNQTFLAIKNKKTYQKFIEQDQHNKLKDLKVKIKLIMNLKKDINPKIKQLRINYHECIKVYQK